MLNKIFMCDTIAIYPTILQNIQYIRIYVHSNFQIETKLSTLKHNQSKNYNHPQFPNPNPCNYKTFI